MILSWTDELMRAYDILNSTNDRNLLPLCVVCHAKRKKWETTE